MSDVRSYNVGNSDYSKHKIQPWDIWLEYNLNPWDADIVKRVLRYKEESGMSANETRIMDYDKIIHICNERKRQLMPINICKDFISNDKIITFSLIKERCDQYTEFCGKHSRCPTTAIGGHISVTFTCNSAGLGVQFSCNACGKVMNATNYKNL